MEHQILYIIHEKPFCSYGIVFNQEGKFQYALNPADVIAYQNQEKGKYILIDPIRKTIFEKESEEQAIELISSYFNLLYKEYSYVTDSNSFFDSVFSKIISEYDFSEKKLLDFGSGSNSYSKYFTDSEYVGFDINNNVTWDEIGNKHFDYVLCNFVLEHVANPVKIIERMSSVLKKKGILFLSVPSLSFYEFIKYYVFKRKMILPMVHFRTFGIKEFSGCLSFCHLIQILSKSELNIKKITGVFSIGKKNICVSVKPFCYFGNQVIIISEKS
jgi:SAM-dependent methyltransferase